MFYCQNGEIVYAFRFYHTRKFRKQPRLTFCAVLRRDQTGTTTLLSGRAKCSKKDNFNKEAGRKLSLARAIAVLPRDDRGVIWSTYFSRSNVVASRQMIEAFKRDADVRAQVLTIGGL
jgi:hypothetical protein